MPKNIGNKSRTIITALDIGFSKVACIISEYDNNLEALRVIGVGQHIAQGIKKGLVTNMEALENSILNAVHKAEKNTGLTVKNVYTSISGKHLLSERVDVSISVNGSSVTEHDINRLISQGTTVNIDSDYDVIHAAPINFTLDQTKNIKDPRGMYGNLLTGHMHVITGSRSIVRNLVTCLHRCHLNILGLIPSSYASGLSTLVEDEMDLGVTLIDFGGGSTDIGIFKDGDLIHTECIPVGSYHITNDLSKGLGTSIKEAERIKTLYGSAISTNDDDKIMIDIPQIGDHNTEVMFQTKRSRVTSIIQPRVEEIFDLIYKRLNETKTINLIGRRIVITGGGSQLPGFRELSAKILNKQVRLGKPLRIYGLEDIINSPAFSTCAGLLTFALKQNYAAITNQNSQHNFISKISNWFKEYF
jgi:cell division protein FtsA